MTTKDIILYGAIIFLFIKLNKKNKLQSETTTENKINPVIDYAPYRGGILDIAPELSECQNCAVSMPSNIKKLLDLPTFRDVSPETIDTMQIIPTPASVLSPEQLALYNASIKGIKKPTYIC